MGFIYKIIIFILINISLCKRRIYNITEYEFSDKAQETTNSKIKWLMVLYTQQYDEYETFMALLKEDIYPNYKKNKTIKFGLIEINQDNYRWLINMFDIKGMPCIILVANGSMYYFRKNEVSQESIIQFIDEEKSLNESSPIPPKLNIFIKGVIMTKMMILDIDDLCQALLDKYKIKYKWKTIYTVIIVGIFLFFIFKFQIYFIKKLCRRDKPNNEKENKENGEENISKEKNRNIKEIKKVKNE